LDLVQAEAIRDLIGAETAVQARNASGQLAGLLSERFGALRRDLLEMLARLEGALDFVDQGVVVDPTELAELWRRSRGQIVSLLGTADVGERIREGVRVAIVGRPNSGKSTMFNGLLRSERAIVDDEPGTTRDVIEGRLELAGVPVVLADTAGLRDPASRVEREGMRRTRAEVSSARAVVVLWARDEAKPPPDPETNVPLIRIRSKADLEGSGGDGEWLAVSAVTGDGMETLRERLRGVVLEDIEDLGGEVAIGARHRRALERALVELDGVRLEETELAAEAVRWALAAVRELTGEVVTEEVLDEVFFTFCVGK
jgi:tRNA modification GTPase